MWIFIVFILLALVFGIGVLLKLAAWAIALAAIVIVGGGIVLALK